MTAAKFRARVSSTLPRLALVSTYSELCGIAAYTHSLQRQLADVFDAHVFDLNQYLLRSRHGRVRKFADRHVQEIYRELKDFEAVNLQLEHGTLGRTAHDIFRRFSWIVRAAPQLSVTFHTMTDDDTRPNGSDRLSSLSCGGVAAGCYSAGDGQPPGGLVRLQAIALADGKAQALP